MRTRPHARRARARRHAHADPPASRRRTRDDERAALARSNRLVDELRASPIAIETHAANAQHYELPRAFFQRASRTASEVLVLFLPRRRRDARRSRTRDVRRICGARATRRRPAHPRSRLRLGIALRCGWRRAIRTRRVVGLSNSRGQRAFIEARAAAARAVEPARGDGRHRRFRIRRAARSDGFDRVLSIEMFEHMKNYGLLLAKIAALDARRRTTLRACLRASDARVSLRRAGRQRLDVEVLLHRRHDAVGVPAAAFPGRSGDRASVVGERHALRAHRERLARSTRRGARSA